MLHKILYTYCLFFISIINLCAQGGPDNYGYTWLTSSNPGGPVYHWVNIVGKPGAVKDSMLLDDNGLVWAAPPQSFPIGFGFPYYSQQVWSYQIGSNGWISFPFGFGDDANLTPCFSSLPSASGAGRTYLAPFMTDLVFGPDGGNQGEVWFWTNNVDSLVVSYINVPWKTPTGFIGSNTFQVILNGADSSITFQYKTMDSLNFPNSASCNGDLKIGIQGQESNNGLECYNEILPPDSFAIRIVPPATPPVFRDGAITIAAPTCYNCSFYLQRGALFFLKGTQFDFNWGVANYGTAGFTSGFSMTGKVLDQSFSTLWTGSQTMSFPLLGYNSGIFYKFPTHPTFNFTGQYYYTTAFAQATDAHQLNNRDTTELDLVECINNSIELTYATGGSPTGSFGGAHRGAGVFIIPPSYPLTIQSIDCYITDFDNSGTSNPTNGFKASIYGISDWSFNIGAKQDSVIVPSSSVIENAWNHITFPTGYVVDSGGFYIGITFSGDSIQLGTENVGPISERTFQIEHNSWTPYRRAKSEDFLIQVNMYSPCQTGIRDTQEASSINIFPNPFSNLTTISFSEEQKNTSIRIMDVLGQEIRSSKFTGKQFVIDKGEMKAGIYFVQTMDEKNKVTNNKIIIQ